MFADSSSIIHLTETEAPLSFLWICLDTQSLNVIKQTSNAFNFHNSDLSFVFILFFFSIQSYVFVVETPDVELWMSHMETLGQQTSPAFTCRRKQDVQKYSAKIIHSHPGTIKKKLC